MDAFQKRFAVIYKSRFAGPGFEKKKKKNLPNLQVPHDIETFNFSVRAEFSIEKIFELHGRKMPRPV